jgi:hypothetical protein
LADNADVFELEFKLANLKSSVSCGCLGSDNVFVQIQRGRDEKGSEFVPVFKTTVKEGFEDLKWPKMKLSSLLICNGDLYIPVKF